MAESTLHLPDEAATIALAQRLAGCARTGHALLLAGPLGAGKTSFARAFIRALADDPALEVPSPTFTLLQSYDTRQGTVFHYDLWRLTGPAALHELDWDAAQAGIVLVEWPERLGPLAPPAALWLSLSPTATGREITLRSTEEKWFDAS